MKRILLLLGVLLSLLMPLVAVPNAHAVDVVDPVCKNKNINPKVVTVCQDNQSGSATNPIFGPSGVLTSAIRILSIIVGIGAVVAIIISGLRMALAGGDTNNVATARRSLIYALGGLVLALVAQLIVAFVLNKL
jgi:hypothetical protein